MKSLNNARFKTRHFSLSNGVHGEKTTSAVQKRPMDACIAIRCGTKCRSPHEPSEADAPAYRDIAEGTDGRKRIFLGNWGGSGTAHKAQTQNRSRVLRKIFGGSRATDSAIRS